MIIIPSRFHVVLAEIHGVVHDHVCTHVPHLDLVDFGQNVSTTARLMVSCNPVKKIKISWIDHSYQF